MNKPATMLLVACGMLAPGCGEAGRYRVTGAVTFDGKPVPAGSLTFMPIGPGDPGRSAGFCRVVSGTFDSQVGRSPAGGRHRVVIDGFDGVAFSAKEGDLEMSHPEGRPLFSTHVVEVDVPRRQGSVLQFDVPKQP